MNIVVNGFLIIHSYKVPSVGSVDIIARLCILRSRDINLPPFLTYFTRDTGLNDVVVHGVLCKIINA